MFPIAFVLLESNQKQLTMFLPKNFRKVRHHLERLLFEEGESRVAGLANR